MLHAIASPVLGGNSEMTRGNLNCASLSKSTSAHCLRTDPDWWFAVRCPRRRARLRVRRLGQAHALRADWGASCCCRLAGRALAPGWPSRRAGLQPGRLLPGLCSHGGRDHCRRRRQRRGRQRQQPDRGGAAGHAGAALPAQRAADGVGQAGGGPGGVQPDPGPGGAVPPDPHLPRRAVAHAGGERRLHWGRARVGPRRPLAARRRLRSRPHAQARARSRPTAATRTSG